MLTIFSVPKSFEGHIGVIQRNALRSWCALGPTCQVIVCGDERGVEQAATEFGADWIPDIDRNEFGTPLLPSVFQRAEERATHELLCYANADLIFFPDLLDAVRRVAAADAGFLLVGSATDLELREEVVSDVEGDLRRRVASAGRMRGNAWIDYFVFRRGSLGSLPAFAVGRPYWDNWMIWRARDLRMPVIDASAVVLAIHQSHGYGHVPEARDGRWYGPEGDRNQRLLEFEERAFSLDDATHSLTAADVTRKPRTLKRRIHVAFTLHPRTLTFYRPLRRAVRRVRRPFSRA
jgi:hypothetical protein